MVSYESTYYSDRMSNGVTESIIELYSGNRIIILATNSSAVALIRGTRATIQVIQLPLHWSHAYS